MKILLIQPERSVGLKSTRGTIPIALLYLTAAAEKLGHEIELIDFSVHDVPIEGPEREVFYGDALAEVLKDFEPGLVGITCFSTANFPAVEEISKTLKGLRPETPIVIGGSHPTFFGADILKNCDHYDFIAVGEGEEAICGLAHELESGDPDFSKIPSIIYRTKFGATTSTGRESYLSDLEDLGMPAWDRVDLDGYKGDYSAYYNPKGIPFDVTVPIVTSRSCPFSCSFCSAHLIMGKKYRSKTPSQVVDEMEYLLNEKGQTYFAFIDDVINIRKDHVVGICNEIVRRDLNIQFSVNQGLYIRLVDKEMVDALAAAGLAQVSLPIEHGDEMMRTNILKKKLTDDKVREVVSYIKPHNIFTIGLFIMGFPEETVFTLEKTRKFLLELDLDINAVSTLIPFPRTPVYDQVVEEDLLLVDINDGWQGDRLFDPGTLPKGKFYVKPHELDFETMTRYRKTFDSMYFHSDRAKSLNGIHPPQEIFKTA